MSKELYHTMPCGNIITNKGRVISRPGRELTLQLSKAGYFRVELWHDGFGRKRLIHRLVAAAFVPNPEGKPQVNHKDGDKLNNRAENLEWVTQSENQIHAYKTGLQKGFHVSGRKLTESHKKALCGSRWRGQKRRYIAGGLIFETPEQAAEHYAINRQTVYNRAASKNFPDWEIEVWREEK